MTSHYHDSRFTTANYMYAISIIYVNFWQAASIAFCICFSLTSWPQASQYLFLRAVASSSKALRGNFFRPPCFSRSFALIIQLYSDGCHH